MKSIVVLSILSFLMATCTSSYAQVNDTVHSSLYFPTELLVEKHLEDYWRNDSISVALFAETIGHHPNSCEMDSIIEARLLSSALRINGKYSSYLQELREPILCNGYPRTVYRLTYFHNLLKKDYSPYTIRIEGDQDGTCKTFFSYRLWDYRYCSSTLHQDTLIVDSNVLEELVQMLGKYDFWNEPSVSGNGIETFDGATFIFESQDGDNYHVVFSDHGGISFIFENLENEKEHESYRKDLSDLYLFMWQLTGLRRKMPGDGLDLRARFMIF